MLKKSGFGNRKADEGWEDLKEITGLMERGVFFEIRGREGTGKSTLALTAAKLGKLAYIDIDESLDRAKRPTVREGKKSRPLPDGHIKKVSVRYIASGGMEAIKEAASAAWGLVRSKVESAASSWAGAVCIDTGTEQWELIRLAKFGTVNPKGNRMDRLYGPVNAEFRNLWRYVYRASKKHLVVISQDVDEYKDKIVQGTMQSIRTGKSVRKAFKEIPYMADVTIRTFKGKNDEGEMVFKGEIVMCKLAPNGPSLEGMEIEGDQLDLGWVVATATGTDPEDWKR